MNANDMIQHCIDKLNGLNKSVRPFSSDAAKSLDKAVFLLEEAQFELDMESQSRNEAANGK